VTRQACLGAPAQIFSGNRRKWTLLSLGAALAWAVTVTAVAQTPPAGRVVSAMSAAPGVSATPATPTSAPAVATATGAATTAPNAVPGVALPASPDPVLEARVMKLSAELRCLVCQNQTIADSNAGLAVDLRNQVRDMLKRGDTPEQITDYMTARYGDFVLYRPPVKSTTAVLWYGPAALLLVAVVVLLLIVRRRTKLPPERFEPEPDTP
jgi:cytochrome c-type biogenesis protein CcmH